MKFLVIQNLALGKREGASIIPAYDPWDLVHNLNDDYLSNPNLYSAILNLAKKFRDDLTWEQATTFLLSDIPEVGKPFAMIRPAEECEIKIIRNTDCCQLVITDCPHYIVGDIRQGKIMELSHNQMASIQKLAHVSNKLTELVVCDFLGHKLSAFAGKVIEAIKSYSELKVVREESASYS